MAPVSSITEPLLRFVRDLTSAFISLSSSKLVSHLDQVEPALSSSSSSPPSSSHLSEHTIQKRQNQILSIPATYAFLDTSPQPGTVVGIVLGVVAGVMIVVIAIYQTFGFGDSGESVVVVEEDVDEVDVVRSGSRRSTLSRSRSNRPPAGRRVMEEIVEVRERPSSRRRHEEVDDVDDEVIVVEEEETTGTHYSDDIVEVEEEESSVATSPPRRRRTSGSYRRVDPLAYGGGDDPYRRPRR